MAHTKGVYQSTGRDGGFNQFIFLVTSLVLREFKGQYRRAFLGPIWALIKPIGYMMVFIFLRGVFDIKSDGAPFALFTFCALVPWTFFNTALSRCAPSVVSNGMILKKADIPREIFPIATVGIALFDLLISMIVLVGMLVWYEAPAFGWNLIWLPILILLTGLMALGMGFGAALIATVRRDIVFAMPFMMQFWMLASPVMYPLSQVPERWHSIVVINPMVGIIEGFRNVLIHGKAPDMDLLSVSIIVTVVVWVVFLPLYHQMSKYFSDVL
ncbi:MAG: ABC transporter permease [Magnetococcales bacterium]|nr:ABC transporter permease [Magnetococcales bacterium]